MGFVCRGLPRTKTNNTIVVAGIIESIPSRSVLGLNICVGVNI